MQDLGSENFQSRMIGPLTPDDKDLINNLKENYLKPPTNNPYNLESSYNLENQMRKSSMTLIVSIIKEIFHFSFLKPFFYQYF